MDFSQNFSSIGASVYDEYFYEAGTWSLFTRGSGSYPNGLDPNSSHGNWSSTITSANTQLELTPPRIWHLFLHLRYTLITLVIIAFLAVVEGRIFFPFFFQNSANTPVMYTPELSISLIIALGQLFIVYKLIKYALVQTHPQLKYTPKIVLYKNLFDTQIYGTLVWMTTKSHILSVTPIGKIVLCRVHLTPSPRWHLFKAKSTVAVMLTYTDPSGQDLEKKNFIVLYRLREDGKEYLCNYIDDLLGVLETLSPIYQSSLVVTAITTYTTQITPFIDASTGPAKTFSSSRNNFFSLRQRLYTQWLKHWNGRKFLVEGKSREQELVFELPNIRPDFFTSMSIVMTVCFFDLLVLGYFLNVFNCLLVWNPQDIVKFNSFLILYNAYSALHSNLFDRLLGLVPSMVFSLVLLYYTMKASSFFLFQTVVCTYFDFKSQKRVTLHQFNNSVLLEYFLYTGDSFKKIVSPDSLSCTLRQKVFKSSSGGRYAKSKGMAPYRVLYSISLQLAGVEFILKKSFQYTETKELYTTIKTFIGK